MRRELVSWALAGLLVACGSNSGSIPVEKKPEPEPQPRMEPQREPQPDPPPPDPMPDPAPVDPPPLIGGKIRMLQFYYDVERTWQVSAGSRFVRFPEGDAEPMATAGGCRIYLGNDHTRPPDPLDAGAITVTGGERDLHFTRLPNGMYTVDIPATPTRLFRAGQVLHVASPGGADIPAFAQDMPAPARITVSSPNVTRQAVVERARDFMVTWTGTSGSQLHLEFKAGSVSVACTVVDTDGQFTFPPAALAYLPAGNGYLLFNRFVQTNVRAGDAKFIFEAAEIDALQVSLR